MSSSRDKGKKKTSFNHEIPPFEEIFPSSPPGVEQTLRRPTKRPRSKTTTSLRDYTPELDPKEYWTQRLLEEREKCSKSGEFSITLLTTCLKNFLAEIQKDYTNNCVWLRVRYGACRALDFPGPRKKCPPRTALRGEAGDLFYSTPPRALSGAPHFLGPVFAVSGAPFLLPPANSPFRGPAFCGAPSGALLIVVNFVPEMRISSVC